MAQPDDDDLDVLLSLGDVRAHEVLALVPALIAAAGELPASARPLLARLARAAGVRDDDDDASAARKVRAFALANAPRDEVKRALFTLAAGRALDLVKEGAQAALARFSGERAEATPNDASSGKKGVRALDLRARAKGSD